MTARAASAVEAQAVEPGPGAGSFELRVQTASNVAGGAQLPVAAAPGFALGTESGDFLLNLIGGGGYFATSSFAMGADVGYTLFGGSLDASVVTIAPFLKFVTGMPQRAPGFFVELSPGVVIADVEGAGATYLQVGAWLGGHVLFGRSTGILVGPTLTGIEALKGGDGRFILGLRIGLSVYL